MQHAHVHGYPHFHLGMPGFHRHASLTVAERLLPGVKRSERDDFALRLVRIRHAQWRSFWLDWLPFILMGCVAGVAGIWRLVMAVH